MSPNLSSAHYPQNRLIYEQVLFNLFAIVGLTHFERSVYILNILCCFINNYIGIVYCTFNLEVFLIKYKVHEVVGFLTF